MFCLKDIRKNEIPVERKEVICFSEDMEDVFSGWMLFRSTCAFNGVPKAYWLVAKIIKIPINSTPLYDYYSIESIPYWLYVTDLQNIFFKKMIVHEKTDIPRSQLIDI